jgi:hypothetical protein
MPSFLLPGGSPAEYKALLRQLRAGELVRNKRVVSWREEIADEGRTRRVTLTYAPPEPAAAPNLVGGWNLSAWSQPPSEILEFVADGRESTIGVFDE